MRIGSLARYTGEIFHVGESISGVQISAAALYTPKRKSHKFMYKTYTTIQLLDI